MKIYTRSGDNGETGLFGGQRVSKDALRVNAYGTVDELNSVIGIVLADHNDPDMQLVLMEVQRTLFVLGADLATPAGGAGAPAQPRIAAEHVAFLEEQIDRFDARLEPLRGFILPGGSPVASRLHFARTVCRRAEREAVRLSHDEPLGQSVLAYLNRLSDFLYVLARYANKVANTDEKPWKPSDSRP